jgi:uncharacterized phage protein gp47/JayE
MTAEDTGPTQAPANSLTVIETPVAGLASTKNIEDAEVGRDLETDADLKNRRLDELANPGAATTNAIRSKLLALENVIAVVVFQNNTSVVDLEGRPPHSVDIVVQEGDDQEIADKIFDVVAAGIETIGDEIETVVDSQGFSHTVKFSRPTELDIWLEVDLTTDPSKFPVDGAAQAEQAFLDRGNSLEIGEDVIIFGTNGLSCAPEEIPGITDMVIRIGLAAAPTLDNNIVVDPREIARFDTSRITINVF